MQMPGTEWVSIYENKSIIFIWLYFQLLNFMKVVKSLSFCLGHQNYIKRDFKKKCQYILLIVILIFHREINQSTDYENMKVTRIRNMGTFSHDIFLNILHNSYAKHIHIINKLASGRTAHPNNNFQLKIRLKQILIIFQQLAKKRWKGRQMFQRSLLNNRFSISLSLPKMAWPSFKQIWNSTKMQKFGWKRPFGLRSYSMLYIYAHFSPQKKLQHWRNKHCSSYQNYFFFWFSRSSIANQLTSIILHVIWPSPTLDYIRLQFRV